MTKFNCRILNGGCWPTVTCPQFWMPSLRHTEGATVPALVWVIGQPFSQNREIPLGLGTWRGWLATQYSLATMWGRVSSFLRGRRLGFGVLLVCDGRDSTSHHGISSILLFGVHRAMVLQRNDLRNDLLARVASVRNSRSWSCLESVSGCAFVCLRRFSAHSVDCWRDSHRLRDQGRSRRACVACRHRFCLTIRKGLALLPMHWLKMLTCCVTSEACYLLLQHVCPAPPANRRKAGVLGDLGTNSHFVLEAFNGSNAFGVSSASRTLPCKTPLQLTCCVILFRFWWFAFVGHTLMWAFWRSNNLVGQALPRAAARFSAPALV